MQVEIDVENILDVKKKMKIAAEELDKICGVCYQKIDETKEIFNTPTAEYFREKSYELVSQSRQDIDNKLIPLIDSLDTIVNSYKETFKAIEDIMDNGG